jgi:hypothetical protein
MATAVKKRAVRRAVPVSSLAHERPPHPEEPRVRAAVEKYLPGVKDLVRSYEVEFRENFAGEPSVYITLRIPNPDKKSKPSEIDRLFRFWQDTTRDILEKDATYFPYIHVAGM